MKRRKNIYLRIIVMIALIYIALLVILYCSESANSDALIIYGEKRSSHSEKPDYLCIYLSASPDKIVAQKKNIGTKCKVFLMKENDIGVNSRAINLHKLPVEVYARTTNGQDKILGNINFFTAMNAVPV